MQCTAYYIHELSLFVISNSYNTNTISVATNSRQPITRIEKKIKWQGNNLQKTSMYINEHIRNVKDIYKNEVDQK